MKRVYALAILAIMSVAFTFSAAQAADDLIKVGDVVFFNPPTIRPGDIPLDKNGRVPQEAFSQLVRARLTYIGTVESCPVVSLNGQKRSELVIYDLIESQKVILIAWETPDYWQSRLDRREFYGKYALPPGRGSYSLNFYTHNHYFNGARVRISGVRPDGKEEKYEFRLKHRWTHGHSWEKRIEVPVRFYVREMTIHTKGGEKIHFRVAKRAERDGYVHILLSSLPKAFTYPRININNTMRWPAGLAEKLQIINFESSGKSGPISQTD